MPLFSLPQPPGMRFIVCVGDALFAALDPDDEGYLILVKDKAQAGKFNSRDTLSVARSLREPCDCGQEDCDYPKAMPLKVVPAVVH